MTNEEFSNGFTTQLASYSTAASFGEQASRAEIVLDEYEKSVYLTQAQDYIVKSYFDARLNQEGAGFDDNTKRQLDFSSLIKVKELSPIESPEMLFDDRSILYQMPKRVIDGTEVENATEVLFILNEKLRWKDTKRSNNNSVTLYANNVQNATGDAQGVVEAINTSEYKLKVIINMANGQAAALKPGREPAPHLSGSYIIDKENKTITATIRHFNTYFGGYDYDAEEEEPAPTPTWDDDTEEIQYDTDYFKIHFLLQNTKTYGEESWKPYGDDGTLTQEVLSVEAKETLTTKDYVIVPLNYKEYDRMMSRPYSGPLKKQAWRLFQNQSTGFDTQTELIPAYNVEQLDTPQEKKEFIYRLRYVRKPQPIVLEDMPDNLSIDGYTTETSCELNPVVHQDILDKAVELAVTARGGTPAATQARQERYNQQRQ